MMNNFTKEDYSFLASIGLTFDEVPNFNIQPEAGLLQLLNREEFIGNYMYGMLKLFLKHFHEYIRIDILVAGEKSLTPVGRSTLSALASFCYKDLKDKRFKKIKKYSLKVPLYLNSKEYVNSVGYDAHLAAQGIIVREIKIQNEKKIRSDEWLLKKSIWFKNRLIFGLGVRADAFSVLQMNQVKTYYELSKILGSSLFSARKNFQDFLKIQQINSSII